jgi:hypothetical protein
LSHAFDLLAMLAGGIPFQDIFEGKTWFSRVVAHRKQEGGLSAGGGQSCRPSVLWGTFGPCPELVLSANLGLKKFLHHGTPEYCE